ncbi:tyrosine-type recombinase/integrase [Alkalicoccobacillus plakortidis]|uniref:Site-specific integrase n=1 Tax=Alkalicoccobacillus plakortidis TaxID=444060 RepID=A0ABT0XK72_9BACI|nr:site-specific integrase [Alkalicoccobacillus plakortidis]MCM2675612.1 site-specific integrase [Alkalicoccobacillus plakortidis]
MASINELKSGWQYRISYKKRDGTFGTLSKNNFKRKKDCILAAAEIEKKLKDGHDLEQGDRLFHECFREWYEIFRKGKKSKANDGDIRRAVEFAEEKFPFIKFKDLNRKMYQNALNEYAETHSTSSVKKHHTYMRTFIMDAIEDGVITKNPTYKVIAKGKVESKEEDLKYLNYQDSQSLIVELTKDLKYRYISRYIILFALTSGCRFSEIMGITWDSVDFKNKKVRINKSWDYAEGDFGELKNKASKRTLRIDDKTMEILKSLKSEQQKVALASGLRNENNLVFVNNKFHLVTNNAVNKTLKGICKKILVTEITCHHLRHTHASILLFKKCNIKYISRRLGHGDIVTTLQTYSHIIDEMEQMESEVVNDTMSSLFKVM